MSIRIRLFKAAVTLQCWTRTIIAQRVLKETKMAAETKAKFAFEMVRRIQMCFRRHDAREKLRIKKKHYRNACILQKFARRKVYFLLAWSCFGTYKCSHRRREGGLVGAHLGNCTMNSLHGCRKRSSAFPLRGSRRLVSMMCLYPIDSTCD